MIVCVPRGRLDPPIQSRIGVCRVCGGAVWVSLSAELLEGDRLECLDCFRPHAGDAIVPAPWVAADLARLRT